MKHQVNNNNSQFICVAFFYAVDPTVLTEEVNDAIETLKVNFNDLKKKIRESLDKHKVAVTDVADALTSLSPDDDECHKLFLKENVEKLYGASSNTVLFGTMNFHWNYLDPSLLEYLIQVFRLNEVKENMKSYKSDLKQFRMTTPLRLFCETQRKKKMKLSPEFKEMIAEFDLPNDATLEVVEQFRQEYASHYNVHKFAMMVADVRSGSFIITWFIPQSVAEKLKGEVPIQILRKYSITALTVAGVCVYYDKTEVIQLDFSIS